MSEHRRQGSDRLVSRLRIRMSPHVIGYAALFFILAGTAVALPGRNSVFSDDIVRNGVKTRDIANKAVTATKTRGLIKGSGQQFMRSFTVSESTGFLDPARILARVPSMGVVELIRCGSSPRDIRIRPRSFDNAQAFPFVGQVTFSDAPQGVGPPPVSEQAGGLASAGSGSPLIADHRGGPGALVSTWDFHLWRNVGSRTAGAHVSVSAIHDGSRCRVVATTVMTG